MKTEKAFLILATAVAGTSVYADKVTLDQTPPAVQQAIRARSALRPIEDIDRNIQNGQTNYEASWKDNAGQQQELLLSGNGQILRDVSGGRITGRRGVRATTPATSIAGFTNAQPAPLNWASETVQNKLKAMANGSEIQNFQKGNFRRRTAYEASYMTNGNNVTVVLGEDGSVLATTNGAITTAPVTGTITTSAATGSVSGFANAQQAPLNWASETVQNKFKQMANGTEVQNFQKGQYNGRTAYLGTVSQNGQPMTYVMGEDGSVLTSVPTAVGSAPGSVTGISSGK
jgi:hypothetical protein